MPQERKGVALTPTRPFPEAGAGAAAAAYARTDARGHLLGAAPRRARAGREGTRRRRRPAARDASAERNSVDAAASMASAGAIREDGGSGRERPR